jgi:hypothetical protein
MTEKRMLLKCVMALAILTGTALAQDTVAPNIAASGAGEPGGTAQIALAHRLYAQGIARRDAVDVMTAARLAREVKLSPLTAPKVTEAVGATEVPDEKLGAPGPVTIPGMIAAARSLSGNDDVLLTLLDRIEAELPDGSVTAAIAESPLAAGQRDIWTIPFFGAALAEVAVIGDGDGNLDLTITDDGGAPICLAAGPGDIAYCDWVPARNGSFTVTVTNLGPVENTYQLLRN